ncbi:YqgE/AlgH family protein [Ferrovum sp.]|uniref:YqgE/AlgH family protein n=2 Tax=Ferrovum sp. TaxID=2609467 RepID=UPI002609E563|nr:YqgE/AlgH family protein [Ferrovum sp.]
MCDNRPMETINFTHHFLIAMPSLQDANFSGTLTYICRHDEQGAMGLIINRPMDMNLKNLFGQIALTASNEDVSTQPVYLGGPVQTDRGFVLHTPMGTWRSTLRINDEFGLTTSRDILEQLALGHGPEYMLIALGYAGWEAGQLENEIKRNNWLSVPADPHILFTLPAEQRFNAALALLGVNLTYLSEEAGHA